jgi:cytochrome b subunit of formate dehydrogenase
MLGGLFLNIAFDLIERRREGARVMKTAGVKFMMAWLRRKPLPELETVTRFSVTERLEHLGSMVSFMMLVFTGLPQTRPDWSIAHWIIGLFGGIAGTRIVHRTFGFFFVALMLTHVVRAVVRAIRSRHMPVMVANRKDFADLRQLARHFLFRAPRPKSGKFDLAAKFEYWGLFLGGVIMSVTGVILVWPVIVTHLLPGQIVAASRTMHGLEATFAVLVVTLWHSYGVILRPDIFPLDTSIFTGQMSVERLREEHPLEYKRLFPDRPLPEEPDEEAPGLMPGSLEPATSD